MVSLGQGQGEKAKEIIIRGMKQGDWVLVQNCHLNISWLEVLELLLDNMKNM